MIMRFPWVLVVLTLLVSGAAADDSAPAADANSPARLSIEDGTPPLAMTEYGSQKKSCKSGDNMCCYDEQLFYLFPENQYVDIHGWMDIGFMLNGDNPSSQFHGPYNQVDRDEATLNQLYLIAEHQLDCCDGIGVGGRIDMLYGSDFFVAQSGGLEARASGADKWNGEYYGLALPQLYGEVGNKTLSAKIGHFYSLVGLEDVQAVNNFFYSKAYSYQFAGPFTHWGGIASWKVNEYLTIDGGLVDGWNALDRDGNRTAVTGRATVSGCDDAWSVSFNFISGDERTHNGQSITNRTRYSLIGTLKVNDRVQYVFHHWLGGQADEFGAGQNAEWYGIDQYLYYELNCNLKLGARLEWFRDDDGVRVGLNRPSNPNKPPFVGNFYSLTFGANWTPMHNVTIRPEVRWDWFDGTGLPYDDGRDDSQFTVGVDATIRF